jgi:hypothetical protein
MRPPRLASVAWYPKQWRLLLLTDEQHPSQPGTFMASKKAEVHKMLNECLRDYGVSRRSDVAIVEEYHFRWRGKRYPIGMIGDVRILKEIIWELYELNFRSEFEALDNLLRGGTRGVEPIGGPWVSMYHQTTVADLARLQQIKSCLPGTESCTVALQWPMSSEGVAASTAASRAKWILSMKSVMKGWPGSSEVEELQIERNEPAQFAAEELERLEEAVARFYCQSFFNIFGRPPIIPHRLDEILPGDIINF